MSLVPNIKQVLAILQNVIKQTPLDKQPFLSQKLMKVHQKYHQSEQQLNEAAYLKQLEFNLNFIRLSFPHLDYSVPQESHPQEETIKSEEQSFFQLQNKEQIQEFLKQTENITKTVREEVEFSNWGAGNVDPDHLKKHRQLLQRQYFGGEFWKDKQKPVSPTANYLMGLMQGEPPKEQIIVEEEEKQPTFEVDPDTRWQKVKR